MDYSEHDAAYILKMVNMRYAMGLNSYQQWLTTVLASDVSDATAAAIMENQDSLQGVDISEDSRGVILTVNILHRLSDIRVRYRRKNMMI